MSKKSLCVLGSTGSIGTNTLDIIRKFSTEFSVHSLSCFSNIDLLSEQIQEFKPQVVTVQQEEQKAVIQEKFPHLAIELGQEGLAQIATSSTVDMVVAGIVGSAGLYPTYSAIEKGKTIALANKETMVLAGELMTQKAQETGSQILPVDSEHNAIFQSLVGHSYHGIEKLILTASGGPFRDLSLEKFSEITVELALQHPNWNMGKKITIDSSTMMNKGLEVIEAKWLFHIEPAQIEVMIHRESIVHSLVQYIDGSFIAQLGLPDMRVPIAYCLSFPQRIPLEIPKMNLAQIGKLHFEEVSHQKYPCLSLAMRALQKGGGATAVLNGANEEVVSAFLNEQIHFTQISSILTEVLQSFEKKITEQDSHYPFLRTVATIQDALHADQWGRESVQYHLATLQ